MQRVDRQVAEAVAADRPGNVHEATRVERQVVDTAARRPAPVIEPVTVRLPPAAMVRLPLMKSESL